MVVHLKIISTGLENYPWFPDESSSLGKMLAAPGQELFPLLCILGFWLCYFIRVFVLSKQKDVGYSMKFALAFSVAGYLIMGLVNDSMTVTAPIFWVLLGVGSAWNFIDHA